MKRVSNQYFLKDKKVMLIGSSSNQTPNGYLDTTYKYITSTPIWAYTSQLSQEQSYYCHALGGDETRLFVVNYRNDLNLYDLVEYKGQYYSITRLDTTDGYNGDLFIYVKDVDRPATIAPAD